jgi:YegS/Rv2252/BmrU family lipid kinase
MLIIVNPTAAAGRAVSRIGTVEHILHRRGISYELRFTESPGHATDMARDAAVRGGYGAVVAAGGDGTANEVLNGLMQAIEGREAPGTGGLPDFGVLPVGRGNDFAYGAGIPAEIPEAVELLAGGGGYEMDVGVIRGGMYPGGRFFGNGIGIGFDTIVGLEAAKARWASGAVAYVYGALKTFMLFPEAPRVTITYGNRSREHQSHQISIMNGKRMGGSFFMAPQSSNCDGQLDLCMPSRSLTRREMAAAILQYTRGTQSRNPLFLTDRAPHFTVEAPEGGLICHADGETITTDGTHLEVECLPQVLTVRGVRQLLEEAER